MATATSINLGGIVVVSVDSSKVVPKLVNELNNKKLIEKNDVSCIMTQTRYNLIVICHHLIYYIPRSYPKEPHYPY